MNLNKNTKRAAFLFALVLVLSTISIAVSAQEISTIVDKTVCCEKTKSGLSCQDIPESECAANSRKLTTGCASTSFCKSGYCFDSQEGTCLDHTPQIVCNGVNNGTWSATKPPQCDLGCCVLGDQASFVTLTRCKKLSSYLGLETNFKATIKNELQCVLSARADEKGACVYRANPADAEPTCKLTTRSLCTPEKILKTTSVATSTAAYDTVTQSASTTTDTSAKDSGLTPASTTTTTTPSTTSTTASTTDTTSTTASTTTAGTTTGTTTTTGNVVSNVNIGSTVVLGAGNKTVSFYAGKLCSDESLGTNCGPTEKTECIPGKEEVYFIDTCGNPANIYDSSRINDKTYWANIIDRDKSCNPNSPNINSQSCGTCNYLLGSYCRASSTVNKKPAYGDNICASLNCVDQDGKSRLHGESWCTFDAKDDFSVPQAQGGIVTDLFNGVLSGQGISYGEHSNFNSDGTIKKTNKGMDFGNFLGPVGGKGGNDPVGSRFYRLICVNGEVISEPCADYRQEECIENVQQTSAGPYSEAACRVNRWQDCTAQTTSRDCLNSDRRDCVWFQGIQYIMMGKVLGGSSLDAAALPTLAAGAKKLMDANGGAPQGGCVPRNPPGLKHWEQADLASATASANAGKATTTTTSTTGTTLSTGNAQTAQSEAAGICAQANAVCPVTFEKKILGKEKCVKHCECLTKQVELQRAQLCSAMGDCGLNVNWVGKPGSGIGYKVRLEKADGSTGDSKSGGILGGLFG